MEGQQGDSTRAVVGPPPPELLLALVEAIAALERAEADSDLLPPDWPVFSGRADQYSHFKDVWINHRQVYHPYMSESEACRVLETECLPWEVALEVQSSDSESKRWEILDSLYAVPRGWYELRRASFPEVGDVEGIRILYEEYLYYEKKYANVGRKKEFQTVAILDLMLKKMPDSEVDLWHRHVGAVSVELSKQPARFSQFVKRRLQCLEGREEKIQTVLWAKKSSCKKEGSRAARARQKIRDSGGGKKKDHYKEDADVQEKESVASCKLAPCPEPEDGSGGVAEEGSGTMRNLNEEKVMHNFNPAVSISSGNPEGPAGDAPVAPRRGRRAGRKYSNFLNKKLAGIPFVDNGCAAGCREKENHTLSECENYLSMSLQERWRVVLKNSLCHVCFSGEHEWKDCGTRSLSHRCHGTPHNHLLCPEESPGNYTLAAQVTDPETRSAQSVLLQVQEVHVENAPNCVVLYDTGSQVTLVTEEYAQEAELRKVRPSELVVNGVGEGSIEPEHVYEVPLLKISGGVEKIEAHGVPTLMPGVGPMAMDRLVEAFPEVPEAEVCYPKGEVNLLIGLDNAFLHPVEVERTENMILYISMFGVKTHWMVAGLVSSGSKFRAIVAGARVGHFVPLDFISAEALGTEMPRRCASCKKCSECKFRTSVLTFQQNAEYEAILDNLTYDDINMKWTVSYPFVTRPEVLQNNEGQAMACMRSQERRLIKQGRLDDFNKVFQETVDRGVFRKLSEEEKREWTGPVNYISMVEAFKQGPHSTTPIRICMNSSMKQPPPVSKSLNDCLVKGPPALADLFSVTVGIREHRYALVKDLSKFYNCVLADPVAQHVRRVLWRAGSTLKEPDHYVTTTVNFGDKPAGCIAIAAVRETASMFGEGREKAAWFLKHRTYVDDCTAGSQTLEELHVLSRELEEIVEKGGFKFKETHMSGDPLKDGVPIKVLGLIWDTEQDHLAIDVKVNFAGKRKGARICPDEDIEEEEVDEIMPDIVTKRIVWRVSQAQYDPLGLLAPYMVQFKLVMRDLCAEDGKVKDWDEEVSQRTLEAFKKALEGLREVKQIKFPRSIQPSFLKVKEPPMLLIFGDGSREAYAALAYIRWVAEDGSVECKLIAGKSRVTPKKKISIPRVELMGALIAVRLARKLKDSLGISFKAVRYFTDSSAVLGMLKKDSASFLEFVGTRVSEVKTLSDPNTEWFWLPTEENLADMGTRPHVEPSDMLPGTPYQVGHDWMRRPEEDWPVKKDFCCPPPPEEVRKDLVVVAAVTQKEKEPLQKFRSLAKVLNIYAYVFMAIKKWKSWKKKTQAQAKRGPITPPSGEAVQSAEYFLIEEAQRSVEKSKIESLLPEKTEVVDMLGVTRSIILVGGRVKARYRVGYDKDGLPVLPANHPLSILYLTQAHEIDHGGVNTMVMRSRGQVWIIQAAKTAKKIKRGCYRCRRLWKPLAMQKMAPMAEARLGPAPIFNSTAVDLFGPMEYKDMVKKRVTGKGWGVIFVCMASSAIHIELTESYSTDSFLQALRRFMCLHGTPSRFQSDQGDQLVAASKQVHQWDFSDVDNWCKEKKIEWNVVPTGAQHMNGQAERMIGLVKKVLIQTLENKNCSFNELSTILSEAALIVNSRPIGIAGREGDMEAGGPITPLHLMMGRATIAAPKVTFEDSFSLTRRLQFVESVKAEFWNKWKAIVFQGLDKSYKWRKEHRDMKVGDVVLLKDETNASSSYRIAKISEVLPTTQDDKIRKVVVVYKNPNEKDFRRSTRPIHKLVLVVPVEDGEASWERQDPPNIESQVDCLTQNNAPSVKVEADPDSSLSGAASSGHPAAEEGGHPAAKEGGHPAAREDPPVPWEGRLRPRQPQAWRNLAMTAAARSTEEEDVEGEQRLCQFL